MLDRLGAVRRLSHDGEDVPQGAGGMPSMERVGVMFAVVLPGQWGSYQKATYLFATYCAFGVMGPALFGFGVGLAMEREQGLLELKRVSPMPIAAYFVAKIAMSLAFALAVIVVLTFAAAGFGGVRIAPGSWALLTLALLLGTLPFCAFVLWIVTLVKGQAAVAFVTEPAATIFPSA